jgi:hypothetical protein
MNKLICCLSFFIIAKAYSQDYNAIKHKTDSVWKYKGKSKGKTFKSEFDSISYRVSYIKKSKEILLIEERHYPASGSLTNIWFYKYHFRQGRLILMSKWNNTGLKYSNRQNALYYFENEKLLHIHEEGTSIPNIDSEINKANQLLTRFQLLLGTI